MTHLVDVGLSNAVVAGLLALAAGLAGLLLRRRPAVVHALWLLVLLKLVTPPLVLVPLSWPHEPFRGEQSAEGNSDNNVSAHPPAEDGLAAGGEVEPDWVAGEGMVIDPAEHVRLAQQDESDAAEATVSAPVTTAALGRKQVVAAVWLAGSALWFALAAWRLWRFARLLRLARPADAPLVALVARLSRELGLGRVPAVWLVPGRLAPMVWALFGRPRLILPEELLGRLRGAALETLLLHELAHIRRADHWVRRLEFIALGLFWWHPATWLARRELRDAEELCCDAWVVALRPRDGRHYATTLVDVLDFLSDVPVPVPALGSGLGRVSALKERLTMILRGTTSHGLGGMAKLALLTLAALVLPLVPTLAQAQEPGKVVIEKKILELKKPGTKQQSAEDEITAAVKQRMAEIEALKDKLAALQKAKADGKKGEQDGKTMTVQIVLSGVDAKDLEHLKNVLEKVLPGKKKLILVNAGQVKKIGKIDIETGKVQPPPIKKPGEKVPGKKFVKPGFPTKNPEVKKTPTGEQRLEVIEKTLKYLMTELDSLKKDLKGGGKFQKK